MRLAPQVLRHVDFQVKSCSANKSAGLRTQGMTQSLQHSRGTRMAGGRSSLAPNQLLHLPSF